ncbi:MAG TPA: VOC family protein [Saprospiraceae bacterium]|nr:VOC family protein [Saprospiraceae bacterium]
MKQDIARIAIVVNDYDEAIEFYTKKLLFDLIEDTRLSETKCWVVIAPKNSSGCNLLLAKAKNEEQKSRIGNQTGGRVFLFLYTDDFENYFKHLKEHDVKIIRPPSEEEYGRVAVFTDLYGNLWDLIEPKNS